MTDEDPDLIDSDEDSDPLQWSYEQDRPAGLVCRGYPERYDLNYVVLVQFQPEEDGGEVEDYLTLASEDESLIRGLELRRPPAEIHSLLGDTRIDMQLEGSGIDNQVIYDKFRKLFMGNQFCFQLSSYLRDNQTEQALEFLENSIRDRVFPGSAVEQEIYIYPWTVPEVTEPSPEEIEEGEKEQEEDSLTRLAGKEGAVSKMLTVAPRVRPFLGTEIGKLQPGDVLEVRVIGNSALRLRREHLDPSATREQPYSRPLEARMVALEQGKVPQVIRFLVELSNDIYGIGSVARDTRVFYNEQLVRVNEPPLLKGLRLVLFISSILLFVSLFLLFLIV